ncbi:MAG: helix-turn-helix domain-containing protein [Clostridiales bacterium]|nr:helix-turn-helix domain-containing protein [Clostridiales bacterium]
MSRRGKYEIWRESGRLNDILLLIEGRRREGVHEAEIAREIGLSASCLSGYKKRYPEFAAALNRQGESVDVEVENALLKRALGFRYEEITRELKFNSLTGEAEMVPVKVVCKEVAPDMAALLLWLKNRRPHRWSEKPDAGGGKEQFAEVMKGLFGGGEGEEDD